MATQKKKPIDEVKLGNLVVSIWANETDNGIRHNVTITRLYKEGDQWNDSTSFGRDDLSLVAKVADMAHTWVYEHASQDSGS